MDPRQLSVDDRLMGRCVFCGDVPGTRDHVPSKILLDDPLPDNLPIVDACTSCNQGFSIDEEYLACLLEVILSGTTVPEQLGRQKVKRSLARNQKLTARLEAARRNDSTGRQIWMPEMDRVQYVVLKLARGHAAYELSLPQLEEPLSIIVQPFLNMTDNARADFENASTGDLSQWPEVGSRAFMRACGAEPYAETDGPWVVVQADRYRYSVDQPDGVSVRIVLSEYLACQVKWE